MREKAVDILRKIKKHKLSKWKVISPVLRAIVTQREELINDETFSAHVSVTLSCYTIMFDSISFMKRF